MDQRDISVPNEGASSMATFSLIAVIVVVGLIALFVWQPWNTTLRSSTVTSISQPGAAVSHSQTPPGKNN